MKLSYLIKECTPVWTRIIGQVSTPLADPASTPRFDSVSTPKIDPVSTSRTAHVSTPQPDPPSTFQADPEITSIHASAQDVKPGGLFIAIKGFKADGHDYIDQALANGAAAIITGRIFYKKNSGAVMVEVKDTRKAMSSIAARFYGNPSNNLVCIGITGTNGKTTTTWILESILKAAGHETGVIGTVNFRYKNQNFNSPVTTPESIDLHRILAQMKKVGVTHVIMEVSSHAIDLHRVRNCAFDTAIFTNLSQDHLDYHKTMGAYFACKKRLFTRLLKRTIKEAKRPKKIKGMERTKETEGIEEYTLDAKPFSVINMNDAWGRKLAASLPPESTITTVSGNGNAKKPKNKTGESDNEKSDNGKSDNEKSDNGKSDNGEKPKHILFTSKIEDSIFGIKGNIHINPNSICVSPNPTCHTPNPARLIPNPTCLTPKSIHFSSNLTGKFNLENILCAAGAAHALGISLENIKTGIKRCHGIPGRLERIENGGERHIFVDYAHTPDALESILKTLKMRAPARLITLFGCGGDRDNSKRPMMGEIAARYSDIIIVTSDNPRSEDPEAIIKEIMTGMEKGTFTKKAKKVPVKKSTREKEIIVEPAAKQTIVEPDRAKALKKSIEISQPGDIVVAAGKGHETYQVIHSGRIDFDDHLILKQAVKDFGFAKEVQS